MDELARSTLYLLLVLRVDRDLAAEWAPRRYHGALVVTFTGIRRLYQFVELSLHLFLARATRDAEHSTRDECEGFE